MSKPNRSLATFFAVIAIGLTIVLIVLMVRQQTQEADKQRFIQIFQTSANSVSTPLPYDEFFATYTALAKQAREQTVEAPK